MRLMPIAIAASVAALCLPAAAQEAPPPADATIPADAPAPAPAPPPAPGWNLHEVAPPPAPPPAAVYPPPDPVDQALFARQLRRHQREVARLQRVMETEGPDFDEEKYDSYSNQKAGGIALIAIGGAGLICTVIYGFVVIIQEIADAFDMHDTPDDGRLGRAPQRMALWTMFLTGVTGIAVGVPLLISGSRGKKRQELLQRKDEILAPFDPTTASLSLFVDPQGDAGGLRLQVTF